MAPVKKASVSRSEAGVVEEDFEAQPNDEAIAAGEHLSEEALAGEGTESAPSATSVPGMSEEEQGMEMTPTVVGPPAYGSPDPVTSAGRLLPLDEHPFNPANLPDDHPAAISEDYGQGYGGAIAPEDVGTSFSGTSSGSDLENDLQGAGADEDGEPNYSEQTKADLLGEAESRNLDVSSTNTKAEIVAALEEDDANS
jgi:hypothetical protein